MVIMMMKNIVFFVSLNVAMIAITLMATPTYTASVGAQGEVRCDACHVIEKEEFSRSPVHRTLECTGCHAISDFGADRYSHNATTSECIWCHMEAASGMNNDAHGRLYEAGNGSDIFTGSNEACNACHSGIELEIEKHSYTGMSIDVMGADGENRIELSPTGENISVNYVNYTSE